MTNGKKKAPAKGPSEEIMMTHSVATPSAEVERIKKEIESANQAKENAPLWAQDKHQRIQEKIDSLHLQLSNAELSALPMPVASVPALKFIERDVPLAVIRVTGNHREHSDEAATIRLGRSLRLHSLQQRIGLKDSGDGSFELIFGSRRLAAARSCGWEEIPAKVYPNSLTAVEVEVLRTIENFGRKDLTPVERAMAVARILDQIEQALDLPEGMIGGEDHGGKIHQSLTSQAHTLESSIDTAGGLHAYVGQQLGFPAKWVRDNAYVSQLGGKARELLAAHRIDVGAARELAKLGDSAIADTIAEAGARSAQGLGGRPAEWFAQQVTERLRSLRTVPWRLDVAFGRGVKDCTGQACATCKFNSKSDPDLFGGALADEPAMGFCTNEACFMAKSAITAKDLDKVVAKVAALVKKDADLPITESLALQIGPVHVKASAAARKAKKELQPDKPAASGSNEKLTTKETPEEIAQGKLEIDLGKWEAEACEAVADHIRGHAEHYAMLLLLGAVPPFDNAWNITPKMIKDGDKAIRFATGNLFDIEEFGKLAQKSKRLPAILEEACAEFYPPFIERWKLEVRPMPALGDFVKEDRRPATEMMPAAAKKRKAKLVEASK